MLKETECIICNKNAKIVLEEFHGYTEDQKFNIYNCSFCDTSFVWPQKVDNKIYNYIYSMSEVVPGYNRYAMYAKVIKNKKNPLSYLAGKEAMYFAVKEILKQNTDKSQKILEVGSGLGYLTYAIAREGYDIVGLDISMDAIQKAENQFGKYYICEDVYQYALDNSEKFDVVILTEVIEHVPDPSGFSSVLLNLLKPGGKIIISTPNKSAYPKHEYWHTELPPVHLTWFSEDSFHVISQQKGLTLSLFDFTKFNKKHIDFTRFKYYESYYERHKIVPTLSAEGKLLEPRSLIPHSSFSRLTTGLKNLLKPIVERLIILSPLMDKKHLNRNCYLCVVLQKQLS